MRKDIAELPSGDQAQIGGAQVPPDDQTDRNGNPDILRWPDDGQRVFYRRKAADYFEARRRYNSLVQGPCSSRSRIPDGH